ncbi:MAG: CRTAC1 family protein [Myxococcales bacterium]|nr:CRTAC1 family protein [Myxococcales bacterium]
MLACSPAGAGTSRDAATDAAPDETATTTTGPGDSSTPGATGDDSSGDDDPTGTGASGGSGGTEDPVEPPPGGVVFNDVTHEAGVAYVQGELHTPPDCLVDATAVDKKGHYCTPEWYSGGAAVGDYDGDGHVDLYVTRIYGEDRLFRNNGDGTFEDRAGEAGLALALHTSGAAFGDVDNDGDLDLYVTSVGELRYHLFINDGAGHFADEAPARGAGIETALVHTGSTPAFGDFDLDGYLDLYVAEHRTHLGLGDAPSHSRLLRNRGAEAPGHFEDVTEKAGVLIEDVWQTVDDPFPIAGVFSLSPAFVDFDGDGYPELLIAADFHCSRLFWNNGDGTFEDGTLDAGVGADENGMGSTVGDFDGDGDLDWFVTSISGVSGKTGNHLYRYEGARSFSDASDDAGVREGFWGWGAAFLDHDNDRDLDLVMTNGWNATLNLQDPMRFWENDGAGVMTEVSAALGVTDVRQGRGLVTFDYDEDGDLDVFVVNLAEEPVLYRNDNDTGNGWLRVKVIGATSNRDGYGARVWLRRAEGDAAQVHEIGAGSHYLGNSEPTAHFGLGPGDAPVYEVGVRFPASGAEVVLHEVARDEVIVVVEP